MYAESLINVCGTVREIDSAMAKKNVRKISFDCSESQLALAYPIL